MNHSVERIVAPRSQPIGQPDGWDVPDPDTRSTFAARFIRLDTARRLIRHPSGMLGLFFLAAVVVTVLLAPLIARYDPNGIDVQALNLLPSSSHPFGTDSLGRDLWARTLYGGRLSLAVGVGVVAIESALGVAFGLLAGFSGKVVDSVIMRLMDVLLAIPGLLLALGIIAVLGRGLESAVIALGVGGIPFYARLTRAMTLKIQEQEYVLAARASGFSQFRTLRRHILPNVLDPLIVMVTTNFGGAILAASALSYLGVGAQLPDADWGSLLLSGYDHMFEAWSEIVFPGIAICITVLGSTLLGDGLTDARNPRL